MQTREVLVKLIVLTFLCVSIAGCKSELGGSIDSPNNNIDDNINDDDHNLTEDDEDVVEYTCDINDDKSCDYQDVSLISGNMFSFTNALAATDNNNNCSVDAHHDIPTFAAAFVSGGFAFKGPNNCDFDSDGKCDAADQAILTVDIGLGSDSGSGTDLNFDSVVDAADQAEFDKMNGADCDLNVDGNCDLEDWYTYLHDYRGLEMLALPSSAYNLYDEGLSTLNLNDTKVMLSLVLENADFSGIDPTDFDGDGVPDATDNCIEVANADQVDTDGDGIGLLCDADLDNDNDIDSDDYAILQANMFGSFNDADYNQNGVVNFVDLGLFKQALKYHGVSGVTSCE